MNENRIAIAVAWGIGLLFDIAPGAASAANLEEVVITARRSEESAQSVPISVSAMTGEEIARNAIDNGASLQKLVPSLTIYSQSRNEETFAIRGLSGSGASAQGQSPSVTPYFAQVPLPTGDGGGPGRYFDLQNVQVLKGPQGTLFGRNSTGGAILFEPKRPSQSVEGYVQGRVGNYAERTLEGAVSLPLVEHSLSSRIAVKASRRDGFTHNLTRDQWLDDVDYQSARVSLLWSPTSSFENLLVGDYYKSKTRGGSNVALGINDGYVLVRDVVGIPNNPIPLLLGGTVPLSRLQAAAGNPAAQAAAVGAAMASGGFSIFDSGATQGAVATQQALGVRKVLSSSDHLNDVEAWGLANISQLDIDDDLTLVNMLGYRSYEQVLAYDFDGSDLAILDQNVPSGPSTHVTQFSEELQLRGTSFDDRLDWTVGLFYAGSETPETQHSELSAFGRTSLKLSDAEADSRSLYGQGTYDLGELVDGLKLTLGYRYTQDYRELTQSMSTNGVCTLPAGDTHVDFANCQFRMDKDFGAGSYTAGIEYQLTPDSLFYLANRRGYRSGGLNTGGTQLGQSDYGSETVTDIEMGLKSDWYFDNDVSARANLALYRTKRADAQVTQSFAVLSNGQSQIVYLVVNEADATIKGLEFDGQLALPMGLQLTVAYAYTDATFDSYFDVASNTELKNQPYPFTPRNKLTVNARYDLPLPAEVGAVSASLVWSRSSSVNFNVAPDPYGKQDSYAQLDLFVEWKGMLGSGLDGSLYATNLTDKEYLIGGIPTYYTAGFTSGVFNEPRMYGVSLKYNF